MSEDEKDMIEKDELPDFEDEVSSRAESSAESADEPRQEYGIPQPLYEDFIPSGYASDEKKRREAQERAEKAAAIAAERAEKEEALAAARAEKEAAKEAKKKEKEDKKKAKILAMMEDSDSDKGESVPSEPVSEPPAEEAVVSEAPAVAVASEKAADGVVSEAPAGSASATQSEDGEPSPKKYSTEELKLRKKYKLDKDKLLSGNDVIPGFVIAKGERVVRVYRCLCRGDGTVCLTNKRILINAGDRSELEVSKVSGIKFSRYTMFSVVMLVFWLIFFGLGLFMAILPSVRTGMNIPGITGSSWKNWFTTLFIVCGCVSMFISLPFFFKIIKSSFYFYIFANQEAPFMEVKNRTYALREKKGQVYRYTLSRAGKESDKAARELGALILEVKEGRYNF